MNAITKAVRVRRLKAVADIHNLVGRHAFYNAAGHYDDLLGTFAQHHPDVTVELADWGVYQGLEGARTALVGPLEEIAKAAGGRAGTLMEAAFTTPVIQVSDDAMTASGVWITLAAQTGPNPGTGKPEAGWAWVHYAFDFVSEDGNWRILHLRVAPRFRTPYAESWVTSSLREQPPPPPLATGPDRPSTAPLADYDVTRTPSFDPVPPPHRFGRAATDGPVDAAEARIRRLEDIQDIHNLMAMHEHLHAAQLNGEEFDRLFAKDAPGLTFEPEDWGVFEGPERIKDCYVDNAPPSPPGIMTEHALTTAVVEIAEDGQTAKAVWISPGHETFPIPGREPAAHWSWGRYGVDFIKVDGEWKFWHFHIYTTFRTPYDQSWVYSARNRPPYFPDVGEVMAGMTKPPRPVTFNQPYHPDTAQIMQPVPPVPYRTFDETWSYTEDPA